MEIELNLPRGKHQQDFLDFLNAEIRSRMSSYSGSVGIDQDGLLESKVEGVFSFGQNKIHLSLRIRKDRDGMLLGISIEAADREAGKGQWKTAAQEFVTSVLAATLADTRTKHFQRSFFFYIGEKLDGEYWLPGYRFANAFPGDPDPYLMNAERVVSIDQNVSAIDEMHARSLADEAARRHSARLTLLLNTGLYSPEHVSRWVWPSVKGKPVEESVRHHMGFIHPSANLTQMPRKGEKCPLGAYNGTLEARYRVAGRLLSLPPEARKILRSIDNADPLVSSAFDCSARLYQVALVCGHQFPSVGLAYRVAAVEAACKADQTCDAFSDFMRKYISSRQVLDDILDYLYRNVRSAHFHGGKFPMGEFDRQIMFEPLMDADSAQRDELHRRCYELTREVIVNWLGQVISDIPKKE